MKYLFTILAIFFYSASSGQLINGGMEAWRTYTAGSTGGLQAPVGWFGIDSLTYALGPVACPSCTFQRQTFQCDTAHSGTYAAKIMSRDMGGTLGVQNGSLTNGTLVINTTTGTASLHGGTPVTQRIDSVTFWEKYLPKNGDSGAVYVYAVLAGMGAGGTDSIVGDGQDTSYTGMYNYILSTPVYTSHTYVMSYRTPTVVPDHIQILFDTHILTIKHDSTAMYIDDVTMFSPTTSLPLFKNNNEMSVLCYPNPSGDYINIQTSQYQHTVAVLCNVLGQQVAAQKLQGSTTEMNIGNLSNGLYILCLRNADIGIIYQDKIVKQ